MAKVAQYQPNQVQSTVISQPRVSAAPGNQVFQSNIQAAQQVGQVAQAGFQIKQRIDTTSAEEALVAFERDKNNMFFNPEDGYFNTQGRNAFDNADAANQALIDLKKQYGDNLGQNARQMFDRAADAQITRGQADITRHSAKGLKAWEVATINSQVENTIENASLYWNQPDKLKVQNALGRQAVIDAAELEGIGAEATNERLQTYDSSFTKTAIASATETSAEAGAEMLEQQGDMLEGPDKVKLEKAIESKRKAEKIQADSQQAILTGANLSNTYDSREEIREEVNKIENAELRSKTMTEAMRQFNLKKQGENEAQAETFERAEVHIFEGGSAETFQAEDPEGWEKLSPKQQKVIESGKPVTTNQVKYAELFTMPDSELAKVNPVDHVHELTEADFKKLVSAVKSARGVGGRADKIDHQVGRTRSSQTTAAIEQILGKKSKWNDDKYNQANSFYDLLTSEVEHREQLKGGQLTSQEFTDTLSDLTRQVTIERSTLGFDFLAPDVEQRVTDIPPENIRVLSQFLRDNGIPVTAENLAKANRQASE